MICKRKEDRVGRARRIWNWEDNGIPTDDFYSLWRWEEGAGAEKRSLEGQEAVENGENLTSSVWHLML